VIKKTVETLVLTLQNVSDTVISPEDLVLQIMKTEPR
jgi:hypothetical protein